MVDRFIMDYVHIERARCAALSKVLRDEPDYLLYCIENSVYPNEDMEHHRKRFAEFPTADDDIEDLM